MVGRRPVRTAGRPHLGIHQPLRVTLSEAKVGASGHASFPSLRMTPGPDHAPARAFTQAETPP